MARRSPHDASFTARRDPQGHLTLLFDRPPGGHKPMILITNRPLRERPTGKPGDPASTARSVWESPSGAADVRVMGMQDVSHLSSTDKAANGSAVGGRLKAAAVTHEWGCRGEVTPDNLTK